MSDVDFFLTLRDAAQLIADAANEQLEKVVPSEWNPEKIKWKEAQGTKGPYERADPQATPNFKAMLADLKAHGGRLTRNHLFYWVFRDQATVGRKPQRK